MENSPENRADEVVKNAVRKVYEPLIESMNEMAGIWLDARNAAEEFVKQEHPHWFIEYKQGTRLDARRRQKMHSRAKKRDHAVRAKMIEILGTTQEAMIGQALTEFQVKEGFATEETEIEYLEAMLESSE